MGKPGTMSSLKPFDETRVIGSDHYQLVGRKVFQNSHFQCVINNGGQLQYRWTTIHLRSKFQDFNVGFSWFIRHLWRLAIQVPQLPGYAISNPFIVLTSGLKKLHQLVKPCSTVFKTSKSIFVAEMSMSSSVQPRFFLSPFVQSRNLVTTHGCGSKPLCTPVVHIKIAGFYGCSSP